MDFNFENNLVLENERTLLQPLSMEHFEPLVPVATADKSLLQYSPILLYTPKLFKEYIESSLQERESKFRYAFAIYDKLEQKYAGSTSFAFISNVDKRLQIGWTWYGKEFQRTGLNRSCKLLLLSYAFETLEFERVEFTVDERNQASRTAVEKIGGQLEGILRSHILMPDGFRRSSCYYSILKTEWESIKESVFLI
jgi:RimJ/RimL family protein N-acetyltransferase